MDTPLSCLQHERLFKSDRGLVAQRGVQPLPVVEDFDVVEDLPARRLASGPPVPRQFLLEPAVEALLGGIVPGVARDAFAGG